MQVHPHPPTLAASVAPSRPAPTAATEQAPEPRHGADPSQARDHVELSPEGLHALQAEESAAAGAHPEDRLSGAANEDQLSTEEQREVRELAQRDREVRAHEQAHKAAGGAHAGAPKYDFTTGPDNRQYATSGSVSIDVSPVSGDPQATIRKMNSVRSAALAPADPSSQDRRVAAQAAQELAQAQREAAEEHKAEDGVGEVRGTSSVSSPSASIDVVA